MTDGAGQESMLVLHWQGSEFTFTEAYSRPGAVLIWLSQGLTPQPGHLTMGLQELGVPKRLRKLAMGIDIQIDR